MCRKFGVSVSVNIGDAVSEHESLIAWEQVNRHLETAARGIPGLEMIGAGTGFGCRDADYESSLQTDAELFKSRLGKTMTVRVGDQEVALPVLCGIYEIALSHVYVADGPNPDCRFLRWVWPEGPEVRGPDDADAYTVLVKVSTKARSSTVCSSLRDLSDEIERRETAAKKR